MIFARHHDDSAIDEERNRMVPGNFCRYFSGEKMLNSV